MEARPTSLAVRGRITVHPRGFGFLTVEEAGGSLSAFVTPPDLNPFLTDDVVSATIVAGPDGRWTANGLSLLERPRSELFGEVVTRRGALFLRADREVTNTDWPLDAAGEALRPGDHVVGWLTDRHVVLVRKVDPAGDLALEQVIARHGLRTGFDPEVMDEVASARTVPHATGSRRDLRDVPTVTIDAASTRDIDDAISVLPAGPDGALRLLVSIADVAEYVRPGSALDRCARERGTSVYLAGRVLPMLPDELSADWLSLVPGEDRSALTVELRVDPEGRITATDVYESLIRSWAKLTYVEVADWLERGVVSAGLEPIRDVLPWFRTAESRIAMSRARRGGMEIARDEVRVLFDTRTGAPAGIESVRPTPAHAMIERFMVAANEAIATWLFDRGVPGVFRVHDQPTTEQVRELATAAHWFGFEAGLGRTLSPLALAAFDRQITGAASEPALRAVLLRSLGPARYTVFPGLHFGLAAPLYLHFTSPIRRYADLAVHRIIKQYLRGHRHFDPEDPRIEALAHHLNLRGRVASRAENDRRRVLVARLMAAHIGEVHAAHITRIRPFGLVAQIDATLVEGTIPLETLPDGPYQPDSRETAVVGASRQFAVGMPVMVRVLSSDAVLGRIEFGLEPDVSSDPGPTAGTATAEQAT